MIVFYKKKVYLRESYSSIFGNENVVLICHLSDLKMLLLLRESSVKSGIIFKVIKNNMAKKLGFLNFSTVFVGSTVCLYPKGDLKLDVLIGYLKDNSTVLFPVAVKLSSFVLKVDLFNFIAIKYKFENSFVFKTNIGLLLENNKMILKYLINLYKLLFKTCQR